MVEVYDFDTLRLSRGNKFLLNEESVFHLSGLQFGLVIIDDELRIH